MNITKKSVNEINYNDLDKEITAFLKSKGCTEKNFVKYGYELVAMEEWGNYESHSFNVRLELPDEDDQKEILNYAEFKTAKILNWMCFDKLIESGEYLVKIYW